MILSPTQRAAFDRLREERASRGKAADVSLSVRASIDAALFDKQRALRDDKAKFKALRCGRRAGKTTGIIGYGLDVATQAPESQVLYIAQTRQVAKRNAWTPLKRMVNAHRVEAKPNETELQEQFSNGSAFTLTSVEDFAGADKLRGSLYDLVMIDEAGSFRPDLLEYLITEAVGPALADKDGSLVLLGTPGRYFAGPFYDATGPMPKGEWSTHYWTARENVAMPKLWTRLLDDKRRLGWADDHPIWQREYLAEWIADATGYVYRYSAQVNDWAGKLPEGHEWNYVMGVDLGTRDAFAICILAWAKTCKQVYLVDEFAERDLEMSQWRKWIQTYIDLYPGIECVGDAGGLGGSILQDFGRTYGLYIRAVEKKPGYKESMIEAVNDQLRQGNVKIGRETKTVGQMMALTWKVTTTRRIEDHHLANDRTDAFLYAWMNCYHREAQEPKHLGESQEDKQRRMFVEREARIAAERAAKQKKGLQRWGR